jgi:predicted PurR-regulated permease PerM
MALVAALLLVLWLFSVLSHFLFLVVLAWLFAISLEPGIRALTRRGLSRGAAAATMGLSAVLMAVLLSAVFGQLFVVQVTEFFRGVPSLSTSLIDWVNARFGTSLDTSTISSTLNLSPSQIASWAESLSDGVLGAVGSLSAVLFDLVTVMVFGFYFAGDGPDLFRTLASWMPPRGQQVFLTVSEITIAKTGGYVVSKILLAALSAVFHGIFFAVIGVPYWLPFALFVGITAQFVPIVGTYLGIILPVLATVFTSAWLALAIVVFAAVYQQIENYVFTPRISKRTMDVNPAIALAAVFVGAAIWGPLGAVIGIPLAAAGVSILDTYSRRYELIADIAQTDQPERRRRRQTLTADSEDGPAVWVVVRAWRKVGVNRRRVGAGGPGSRVGQRDPEDGVGVSSSGTRPPDEVSTAVPNA